jgi:glucans biosynthesis protein
MPVHHHATDPARRRLLQAVAALAAVPWFGLERVLAAETPAAESNRFDFSELITRARRLAGEPYWPTPPQAPELLERVTYDVYQEIEYRASAELAADERYGVRLFHLGKYAKQPVGINLVVDGRARSIRYRPELFDYSGVPFASQLPPDLGFAGFRVMNAGDVETDWLAFQGASYFRSSGELEQYGLSARGIAIDTAVPGKSEEFPRFTEFWIEPEGEVITVYALLDGPSVTGAYRFACRNHGEVVMDVRAEIFQRRDVSRLGIAPLTSMYWYSETEGGGPDWRPEIHDSDGLALWTGAGERLWRPLANPPRVQTNSFLDQNPRGFGLLQRDRAFHNYQDDGVFYNRRPSVWVEPLGEWGAGAVQLVEIPTNEEIYDNIVAYWVPAEEAVAGRHWALDYRLHWVAEEPYPPTQVGRVRATRIGWSGTPGLPETRDPNGRKFVIDFEGGPIETLEQRYDVDIIVDTSAGQIENPYALKVVSTPYWRGVFDLIVPAGHTEPVDLRAYLRLGDRTLTETWIYQYFPT